MAVDAADAAVHRIQDHFVFLREQTQGTAGLLRPEQSTDPLEQHRQMRRFADIIRHPGLVELVRLHILVPFDHDQKRRRLSQLPIDGQAQLPPAHAGQVQVQKHHVHCLPLQEGKGGSAVLRRHDQEALTFQKPA